MIKRTRMHKTRRKQRLSDIHNNNDSNKSEEMDD